MLAAFRAFLKPYTKNELFERGLAIGATIAPVNTLADLLKALEGRPRSVLMPLDPVERRLVAILSVDAVGYSWLLAADEVARSWALDWQDWASDADLTEGS